MTRKIINDVSDELLALAKEAIALGLCEVKLGFMGAGAEITSPSSWALWLTKRQTPFGSEVLSHLRVDQMRGEDFPRTYVGSYGANGPYWGVEDIRAWMLEGLPEGEDYPRWEPIWHESLQSKLLLGWDDFREGVISGWSMGHKLEWHESLIERDIQATQGAEPEPGAMNPSITIEWEAFNRFYSTEDHPAQFESGTPTSIRGFKSFFSVRDVPTIQISRNVEESPYYFEIDDAELEHILGNNPPLFTRVYGYDEEEEERLEYPEAWEWKSPEGRVQAEVEAKYFRRLGLPGALSISG